MTDMEAQIAAEAQAYAARAPDTRVEMVGDIAVIITGAELPAGSIKAFVAHARELDFDDLQPDVP